jgi:hypothetical protein
MDANFCLKFNLFAHRVYKGGKRYQSKKPAFPKKSGLFFYFSSFKLVPGAGIEPARPFSGKRRILSPMCLPVSPPGHY